MKEDAIQQGIETPADDYSTVDMLEKCYLATNTPRTAQSRKMTPQNWMSFLDDETQMSAITIPGTHDSAAYTVSWPFVATQKMTVVQQLDSGIRYFDFRCGIRDDVVEMVHGRAYLGLRLEAVLADVYKWLERHSSEALIIQIKQDRSSKKSHVEFANAISQVLSKRSERWRTANSNPSLGSLRGRIQLFRRFVGQDIYAYGIDVSEWEDNPIRPFTLQTLSGVQLTIQDHYAFPDPTPLPDVIVRKGGDVSGLLRGAIADANPDHWYINFTSAYELNFAYQVQPHEIAVGGWWLFRWTYGINVRLRQYLREQPSQSRRYGIVAMDFPEKGTDDLIEALLMCNFDKSPTNETLRWMVLLVAVILFIVLAVSFCGCDIRELRTSLWK